MKTQFEELMSGLDDVESFLSGEKEGFKVHVPEKVDVKSIRNKLRMTQARFSDVFGFSLDAIKHWEGGRRTPEAPARTLLTVIDKNPAAVLTALQPAVFAAVAGSSKVHTVRYKTMKKTRRSAATTSGSSSGNARPSANSIGSRRPRRSRSSAGSSPRTLPARCRRSRASRSCRTRT